MGSEDCLYANVWTPGVHTYRAQRPIIVVIHGGGFVAGSASNPILHGESLSKKGDVVVVSFNYRLGVLGFLCHPDIPESLKGAKKGQKSGPCGNWGLLDMVAALEWVQANAGAFGGDKTKVTLFGHASGGSAVSLLSTMPMAQGLFTRGVMLSTAPATVPIQQATQAAEDLRATLRAEQGIDWAAGLRLASASSLVEAAGDIWDLDAASGDGSGSMEWESKWISTMARGESGLKPVVDGWVVPLDVWEAVSEGASSCVDLLIGTTSEEATGLARTAISSLQCFHGEITAVFRTRRDRFTGEFLRGEMIADRMGEIAPSCLGSPQSSRTSSGILGVVYGPPAAEALLAAYGEAQYQGTVPPEQREEEYAVDPDRVMEHDLREELWRLKSSYDDQVKESKLVKAIDLDRRLLCAKLFNQTMGDLLVAEPAMRFARTHQLQGGLVYTYRFEAALPWLGMGIDDTFSTPYARMGATHGADLPYVLGTVAAAGITGDEAAGLSSQMQGMLCGFAYSGAPGSLGWMPRGSMGVAVGAWPAYTDKDRKTKILGAKDEEGSPLPPVMKRLVLEYHDQVWQDVWDNKAANLAQS